jgi:hypothetical protein
MLTFPLWKQILTWLAVAAGLLLAVPNLYYAQVEAHNDAAKAVEAAGFATTEQQAALDQWPDYLPSGVVNLGLDLRGGAHLLAEVQVVDVYKARMDGWWPEVRDALRDVRDQVGSVRRQPGQVPYELRVQIETEAGMAAAVQAVRALASNVVTLTGVGQTDIDVTAEGNVLIVQLSGARGAGPAHDPAIAGDHPHAGRYGRDAGADNSAARRGPHPDSGSGHRIGHGIEGADRDDSKADLQPGGAARHGRGSNAGAGQYQPAVDG